MRIPEREAQLPRHVVLGGGRRLRVELEHPLEVLCLLGREADSHLAGPIVIFTGSGGQNSVIHF